MGGGANPDNTATAVRCVARNFPLCNPRSLSTVASLARASAELRLVHPIASPLRAKGFRFSPRSCKPMLTMSRSGAGASMEN
jgi:hypothetical protein